MSRSTANSSFLLIAPLMTAGFVSAAIMGALVVSASDARAASMQFPAEAIGPKQDDPLAGGGLAIGPKQDDPRARGSLAIGPKQDDPRARGTLAIGPKQDDPRALKFKPNPNDRSLGYTPAPD